MKSKPTHTSNLLKSTPPVTLNKIHTKNSSKSSDKVIQGNNRLTQTKSTSSNANASSFDSKLYTILNQLNDKNFPQIVVSVNNLIERSGINTESITDYTNICRDSAKATQGKLILLNEAIKKLDKNANIKSLTLSIPPKFEAEEVATDLIDKILQSITNTSKHHNIQAFSLGKGFLLSNRNVDSFLKLLEQNLNYANSIDLSALSIGNISTENRHLVFEKMISNLLRLKPSSLILSKNIASYAMKSQIQQIITNICVPSKDKNGKVKPAGIIKFPHDELLTCQTDLIHEYYTSYLTSEIRQIKDNIEFCEQNNIPLDRVSYSESHIERFIDVLLHLKSLNEEPDFASTYIQKYGSEQQKLKYYS